MKTTGLDLFSYESSIDKFLSLETLCFEGPKLTLVEAPIFFSMNPNYMYYKRQSTQLYSGVYST